MELTDAINRLKESLADHTHEWGCEECKAEHEQLLEWLEDYKQLKADYIELDMQLRTANTENDELKRMLRLAVDTMDNGSCSFDCQKCERLNYKGGCGYDGGFKWRHHDEAMELLGGTDNA